MTEAPPSRYRVVEEGRRLVVIDRWEQGKRPAPVSTGTLADLAPYEPGSTSSAIQAPALQAPTRESPGMAAGSLRRTSFDGRAELRTHPFFDAKGPRTIMLVPGGTSLAKGARTAIVAVFGAMVAAFLVSPVLLIPAAFALYVSRRRIRDWFAGLIDEAAREAG